MKRKDNKQILLKYCLYALCFVTLAGCATIPTEFKKTASYAFNDTDDTFLAALKSSQPQEHPDQSGFLLLPDGLDAFVARAALSRFAERSLDVQYYLFHDDLVGSLLSDLLLKAADRGVRVRLLVDDLGLKGRDASVAVLDRHQNIEVRLFNPFNREDGRARQVVGGSDHLLRRMHNKAFIADNQGAVVGGRNIGDEYFYSDTDVNFADIDALVVGPVVRDVSEAFDLYWNSALSYPTSVVSKPPDPEEVESLTKEMQGIIQSESADVYRDALLSSSLVHDIRERTVVYSWGDAVVVYDQPDKVLKEMDAVEGNLVQQLKPLVEDIAEDLIIISPYFVPGKEGYKFLRGLRDRGVRVRILTNSLVSNDVAMVHAGYRKYRLKLLKAGVELYEMKKVLSSKDRMVFGAKKASLHAKSFVLDRRKIFVGSLNLDPRSVKYNTEIGIIFESAELAEEMVQWFDKNAERIAFRLELNVDDDGGSESIVWHEDTGGEQLTFSSDPYAGAWTRFYTWFFSLFPIDSIHITQFLPKLNG
jgi:putative cardiolipin synthase